MDKFGKSQPMKRVEDVRFLTGAGGYVEDVAPGDALHAVFFRSPVAHAEITGLGLDEARAVPGVHLILTAEDMEAAGVKLGMRGVRMKNRDGSMGAGPMRPFLAKGKVRHVGEPVAIVVAESLAAAKDAAELIEFDYEELEAHVTPVPGGPTLHDEAPDNVAYDFVLGDEEAVEKAIAEAAHVVRMRIDDNRVMVASMEPRGCHAEWEDGRLHVSFGGQGVWELKSHLAENFGLEPDQVRVSIPDVGGGFGMKGMSYPEYFAVAQAARALGRPVRWMSERTEAMLSDQGGRDLVNETVLAFDKNFKITAYRIENMSNMGAYNSQFGQAIQSNLFARVLMGTYDVQTTFLNTKGIYTNTAQVDAYRGAGRPEAIYALERSMDNAARVLGVDPWELRKRNFIPADAFPYESATGELYDVGDFIKVLSRAEAEADKAGFAARKAASEKRGKLRGMGLSYYIESILGSPEEEVEIEYCEDGTVNIYVGTQSNGQGHETVYAKFLSDQTGIPFEAIRVIQGDSDRIAKGGGTGGSRSVTVQNNVTLQAVGAMTAAYAEFLAGEMGVDAEKVSFDDERFRADGSNLTPTFLEAAEMARAQGRSDLLNFKEHAKLPGRSYPNGAHIAEVEIDPETGETELVKYTAVDDFGNLISPVLAEGQVHGGVAQGVGQALTERVVYDETGQLLTASFMDYGIPRADDLPRIAFTTEPVPSTANPMGMKGCGEAGTVGALAAVANAVLDAVWDKGIRSVDMPFTPNRVWSMLNEKTSAPN
ncbi:MAG: xanthine dehydrogenase family protein molybdopterin-binding subunit [Rhodobacteraceae bacterium]|nr:xanthine dehydrogenase family protein molybdopterin-binding subunit [Paracoccaceae bacterium]